MTHFLDNLGQRTIEMTIAKVVISLIGIWLISWTPYALVALTGISGNLRPLSPGVAMIPALFAKMSACINPYLYALRHPKVHKEFVSRWCQSCLANPQIHYELSNVVIHQGSDGTNRAPIAAIPPCPEVDKF